MLSQVVIAVARLVDVTLRHENRLLGRVIDDSDATTGRQSPPYLIAVSHPFSLEH